MRAKLPLFAHNKKKECVEASSYPLQQVSLGRRVGQSDNGDGSKIS